MAPKIAPAEWKKQKGRILAMRRSGAKVRGEGGIVERMKREHGFVASRSQYEIQLGKWEERRNLTSLEWCRILRVVDQYRETGNAYQVLLNGHQVPELTLQKKRRMYRGRREYVAAGQISATTLPDCVMICCPRLHNHSSTVAYAQTLSGQVTDTPNDSEINGPPMDADIGAEVQDIGPESQTTITDQAMSEPPIDIDARRPLLSDATALDPSLFSGYGHSHADQSSSNLDQSLQIMQSSTATNAAFDIIRADNHLDAQTFTPAEHAILDLYSPSRHSSPRQRRWSPHGTDFDFNLGTGYPEYSVPFSPALDGQPFSQGNISIIPQLETLNQPNGLSRVQPLIPIDCSIESRNPASNGQTPIQLSSSEYNVLQSSQTVANADALRANLAALLPPDASLSTMLQFNRHQALVQAFESPIYRILISSVENNFAGLENVFTGDVLKLLRQDSQMRSRLVKYLGQTPKAVATALIEKLLVLFIEDQDVFTVKELLSIGFVDPDDLVCSFQGERYTVVERSAMLCNSELLLELLQAGAKVSNSPFDRHPKPLRLTLEAMRQNTHVDLNLVNILLDYGVKADTETFLIAVKLKHLGLIGRLLSSLKIYIRSHSEGEFPSYFREDILLSLIKNLHDDAVHVVEQLMTMFFAAAMTSGKMRSPRYSWGPPLSEEFPRAARSITAAITLAAQLGYSNVVDSLLPFTANTAGPLAGAIRNGSPELIHSLLNTGADVAEGVCRLEGDLFYTTPLAEAIRAQNNELLCSFSNQISWHRSENNLLEPEEWKGFEAALYAASETGNLPFFRRLLDTCDWERIRSWRPEKVLSPSLSICIEKGHQHIALALLDVGADEELKYDKNFAEDYETCKCAEHGNDYEDDRHPLFHALRQRNKVLFDAIMECDLDLSAIGPRCFTEAFEGEVLWAIDILLAVRPYDEQMYLRKALSAAIRMKKKSMVDSIFRKFNLPLSFSDYGSIISPFTEVIENNDVKMTEHLLHLGADPSHAFKPSTIKFNRDVLLPILRAFSIRYPNGISGLGSEALKFAIQSEDAELLDEMLKAKLDVNARVDERTPLGFAIKRNGIHGQSTIGKLLSAGGDANSIAFMSQDVSFPLSRGQMPTKRTTIVRRTALQEAISTRSIKIVRLLIEHGADICRPARLGLKRTPLQHACEVGCIEIVDLLIESGADVNEQPAIRGGATSLQLCAIKGYVGIAIKLLRLGADVHAPPSKRRGRSPLQGAAENGRLDMISVLWNAAGGRRFSEDDCTRAMEMAKENGHMACIDLIKELSDASEVPTIPQASPATWPMTIDDFLINH